MKSVQQLITNQVRIAGEMSFARAAATVASRQIANWAGLESFGTEPSLHGDSDPRKHPGQADV